MYVNYKFRLYPTRKQEQMFLQTVGCCRWIWNNALEQNIKRYNEEKKFVFRFELQAQLPSLKKEHEWLKGPDAHTLQETLKHFDKSLRESYRVKGAGFPKFKSKKDTKCSFVALQYFQVNDRTIKLPKIGQVKFKKHREIVGDIRFLTISRDVDQWFVNVVVKIPGVESVKEIKNCVGIDLGIKTFATLSDGSRFELPKDQLSRLEKHLKIQQRKFERKKKGSNNREKQRIIVARQYRKIRRVRENFLHQASSVITKQNDLIAMENLNVNGMVKNHHLARSISNQGWSAFRSMVRYKCQMLGKHFIVIDRFYPSTKTCSNCNHVQDVPLSERTFKCESCGFEIGRDYNASINICRVGMAQSKACGDHVSLNQNTERAGSEKQEIQCLG